MTMQVTSKPRQQARPACCLNLESLLSIPLFRALADASRGGLFLRLAGAGGPQTVSELAQGTDIDLSVVSRHLAILRDAGIIECVRRGKQVHCAVRASRLADTLRKLADALEECCPTPATDNGCLVAETEDCCPAAGSVDHGPPGGREGCCPAGRPAPPTSGGGGGRRTRRRRDEAR